jgi:hypothetical protein
MVRRTDATGGTEPARVYLDQNIYGDMLDEGKTDWKQSALGSVLLAAQHAGKAEVWAGPTHVIETLQTRDSPRRRLLAGTILDLIDARRMWRGHELEAIYAFFGFLKSFAPEAVWHQAFFDHRAETGRQIWLGGLGLLAATGKLRLDETIRSLAKTKATNQLLFARAAANPNAWVEKMVRAVETFATTTDDVFAEFGERTEDDIRAEIDRLAEEFHGLGAKAIERLNKNRDKIAHAHGALEIGLLLTSIFTLPLELQLLFNVPHIVERWPELERRTRCSPLPHELREADAETLRSEPALGFRVISKAIEVAARGWLLPTVLGFEVILWDFQKKVNARKLPTGGLTFDADHAAGLVCFHVIVCSDVSFAESLKTLAGKVETSTGGRWRPVVASNARQLEAALR